jgi:hypothetical protein
LIVTFFGAVVFFVFVMFVCFWVFLIIVICCFLFSVVFFSYVLSASPHQLYSL